MGTSNWQNISYVIDIIKAINPYRILDFGMGFGRWGILAREFLEVWGDENYSGTWKRQIDGVEVFPDYIKPYHQHFYSNIYIEEGYEWIQKCSFGYDLVIFGDVIEHFEKSRGLELIEKALTISQYILINIPLGEYWKQSKKNKNKFEEHKSVWSSSDFNQYKHKVMKYFRDNTGRKFCVALISKAPINLDKMILEQYGKYFHVKNFLKYKLKLNKLVDFIERKKY